VAPVTSNVVTNTVVEPLLIIEKSGGPAERGARTKRSSSS
jgi:hypothetical protein